MFLNIDKINPNKTAAIDDRGNSVTYGFLIDNVADVRAIVPPRSVVFLMCENEVPVLISYIALMEIGAVPLLLDKNMDRESLAGLIDTYKPGFMVISESSSSEFSYTKAGSNSGMDYLKLDNPPYPVHPELEMLLATSGSTGSPKLVRHKKGNVEASARMVAGAFGWTENERPACSLPMNYTMGLNVINTHLYVGATLLLISANIMSAAHWNFLREEEATNFTGVPFSYDIMSKLKLFKKEWPRLMAFSEGGGRLPENLFKEIAEYASGNGKVFFASFGTTETTSRMSLLPPDYAVSKTCSIGLAIPEGEMYLVDPKDDESEIVIDGSPAEGELVYRGPNVTMGYAESIDDLMLGDVFCGTYRTGDLALRDSDGFYYIVGRKSRFLKLLGHRVDLGECEHMIKAHYDYDAACIGDDNKMKVYIATDDDIDPLDIAEFLSQKTGITQAKFEVRIIDEIPRNSYGKILYSALEELN